METEFKNAVAGPLVANEDTGVVEAFVSITGIEDNVKDIIVPGAYEKTLATRTPKGVWSHDWNTPISRAVDVKELMPGDAELPKALPNGDPWPAEAGALYVKMQFNMDTQRGREAYSDVAFFGDSAEWSIGYNVPAGQSEKIDGVRHIKGLNLFEYSPVLFGAASQARTKKSALESIKGMYETDEQFLAEVKSLCADCEADEPAESEPAEQPAEVEPAETESGSGEETSTEPNSVDGEEPQEEQAGTKAVVTATPNAVTVAKVPGDLPEEGEEEADDQKEAIEEAAEDITALAAAAERGTLAEDVLEGLRKIQAQITEVINSAVGTPSEAKPTGSVAPSVPSPTPVVAAQKSMREALDQMIYHSNFDIDRLDTIDNGVRALQKALNEKNAQAVAQTADAVLDEIGFAAQATPDHSFVTALQGLSKSIGEELQKFTTTGQADTTPNVDDQPISDTPAAQEPPAQKELSMSDWLELKQF